MQKDIFLSEEGNQWYNRNKDFEDVKVQIRNIAARYIKKEDRVLEIGCSDGRNLAFINRDTGASCFGIDPSSEAIIEGSKKYPSLNLTVGTADDLNFPDDQFDVVIFGFCLYLIDCKLLLRVLSEADRILRNKGFMINIDFDTKIPKTRSYKHCDGVFTHKFDYIKIFEAIPFYHLVEKNSFSHFSNEFNCDPKERLCLSVLYKDIENSYIVEEDS